MVKYLETTNKNMEHIIYDGKFDNNYKNDIKLKLGDIVILNRTDVIDKDPFMRSNAGKLMFKHNIDTFQLEVKEKSFKEIYFEFTLYKDNKQLTNNDYYNLSQTKKEFLEEDDIIYTENCNYDLLRYLISKGAIKK